MTPADAAIFKGHFRFGAGTSLLSWQQTSSILHKVEPQPLTPAAPQLRDQQGQPQMEQEFMGFATGSRLYFWLKLRGKGKKIRKGYYNSWSSSQQVKGHELSVLDISVVLFHVLRAKSTESALKWPYLKM